MRFRGKKRLVWMFVVAAQASAPIGGAQTAWGRVDVTPTAESRWPQGFYYIRNALDGQCVLPSGEMGSCDNASLFFAREVDGKAVLEAPRERRKPRKYLRRLHFGGGVAARGSGRSTHRDYWNVQEEQLVSEGGKCLVDKRGKAKLERCGQWMPLVLDFVKHHQEDDNDFWSNERQWVEPESRQWLETEIFRDANHWDMKGANVENRQPQTLIAGGAYAPVSFLKIYGVGVYVDKEAYLSSPTFNSFASLSKKEMTHDEAIFKAFYEDDTVDKSVLLKLTIPVTTGAILGAIEHEWDLTPEQTHALIHSARTKNTKRMYGAGTELLFSARAKTGVLEMWLNGTLQESLSVPGLANNVLRQYFGDVPVSPTAKESLLSGLRDLFAPHPRTGLLNNHKHAGYQGNSDTRGSLFNYWQQRGWYHALALLGCGIAALGSLSNGRLKEGTKHQAPSTQPAISI
ncbi:unnamed protein product [Chrysoparadoxa australica]